MPKKTTVKATHKYKVSGTNVYLRGWLVGKHPVFPDFSVFLTVSGDFKNIETELIKNINKVTNYHYDKTRNHRRNSRLL